MTKKEKFKISNRILYTFIILGIIAILTFGAYALTGGVAPNPGHLITDIAPPSGCSSGQFLEFSGGTWICAVVRANVSQWSNSGSNIYYNSGNVGVGKIPSYLLDVGGITNSQSYYLNGVPMNVSTGPLGGLPLESLANDFNGNWNWVQVASVGYNISTTGESQIYTDTFQLNPNDPVLGIMITGHSDDFGFCSAGVPGYFLGGEGRSSTFGGIYGNFDISTAYASVTYSTDLVITEYAGAAGDLDPETWVFSQMTPGMYGVQVGGFDKLFHSCGAYNCPNNLPAYNLPGGLSYIPSGQNLTVHSQANNLGGPGFILCNVYVLYGNSPQEITKCLNAGGTMANNTCQFNAASCPANFVSVGWTQSSNKYCSGIDYSSTKACGSFISGCYTGEHAWNNISSAESCSYNDANFSTSGGTGGTGSAITGYAGGSANCVSVPNTCIAAITSVGCL